MRLDFATVILCSFICDSVDATTRFEGRGDLRIFRSHRDHDFHHLLVGAKVDVELIGEELCLDYVIDDDGFAFGRVEPAKELVVRITHDGIEGDCVHGFLN